VDEFRDLPGLGERDGAETGWIHRMKSLAALKLGLAVGFMNTTCWPDLGAPLLPTTWTFSSMSDWPKVSGL